MKRFLLSLPIVAIIAFISSGCWDGVEYVDCLCTDTETGITIEDNTYSETCQNLANRKNHRLDYKRWTCVKDTTSKKKKITDN